MNIERYLMRCLACNCILSDFEATRKYEDGTYVDLCNRDFEGSFYTGKVKERNDLRKIPIEYDPILQEVIELP